MMFHAFPLDFLSKKIFRWEFVLAENKTNGICNESTLDENLLSTPGNNSASFKQLVNIY